MRRFAIDQRCKLCVSIWRGDGGSLLCKKDHKATLRPQALMLNAELLVIFDVFLDY